MNDHDDIISLKDDGPGADKPDRVWKIAVIDDDPAVHDGTRYALYDYRLRGDGIELLSAFSAAEGRELLRANRDIAVILLDVVMESESAGLELVQYIRDVLKNDMVRIILRTGQPGQAPERDVIVNFDINDYKAKTELTADRLFTVITAGLRSYQQLLKMADTRRGLEIIVEAASTLFDFKSMQKLAEGVLTQLSSLLAANCAGILVLRDETADSRTFSVLAASGCYTPLIGLDKDRLDANMRQLIQQAFQRKTTQFEDNRSVIYIKTAGSSEVVVILEAGKHLSDTDRALVEIFCGRLSIAFDNVVLYDKLQQANALLERRVIERTRELKAANDRLQLQWLRARRTNAFQSEILGMVAHDIRNPLGVILGRTEIVSELAGAKALNTDSVLTQMGHIRDSAQRLTAMVTDLISSAMTDDQDINLRHESIDFGQLARNVVEANKPMAERKSQVISYACDEGMIVECDIDRMRDAMDNLVSNAIKYSQVRGEIHVDTRIEGREVLFSVRDSGPGLMPDDKSRLFGRFQRLSAQPTGGETSTGLGLAIAKRIVDLHGGTIRADSAGPGHGSTFSIRLKLAGAGRTQ
jgi:signal transduction histidine kinase/DNA-binding NarL/FixJ family response regulator